MPTRSASGTSAIAAPADSGSSPIVAAAATQSAAKRSRGLARPSMRCGASIAPMRPQPVLQPMPELRHEVGKSSAETMYPTLTAATEAKRPHSTAPVARHRAPPPSVPPSSAAAAAARVALAAPAACAPVGPG